MRHLRATLPIFDLCGSTTLARAVVIAGALQNVNGLDNFLSMVMLYLTTSEVLFGLQEPQQELKLVVPSVIYVYLIVGSSVNLSIVNIASTNRHLGLPSICSRKRVGLAPSFSLANHSGGFTRDLIVRSPT